MLKFRVFRHKSAAQFNARCGYIHRRYVIAQQYTQLWPLTPRPTARSRRVHHEMPQPTHTHTYVQSILCAWILSTYVEQSIAVYLLPARRRRVDVLLSTFDKDAAAVDPLAACAWMFASQPRFVLRGVHSILRKRPAARWAVDAHSQHQRILLDSFRHRCAAQRSAALVRLSRAFAAAAMEYITFGSV